MRNDWEQYEALLRKPKWWQWRKKRRFNTMPGITDPTLAKLVHDMPRIYKSDNSRKV